MADYQGSYPRPGPRIVRIPLPARFPSFETQASPSSPVSTRLLAPLLMLAVVDWLGLALLYYMSLKIPLMLARNPTWSHMWTLFAVGATLPILFIPWSILEKRGTPLQGWAGPPLAMLAIGSVLLPFFSLIGIYAMLGASLAHSAYPNEKSVRLMGMSIGAVVGFTIALIMMKYLRNAAHRTASAAARRDPPPIDPIGQSVHTSLDANRLRGRTNSLRIALDKAGAFRSETAIIVAAGPLELPNAGDLRFEPVIITPAQSTGMLLWPLKWLAIALIIGLVAHFIVTGSKDGSWLGAMPSTTLDSALRSWWVFICIATLFFAIWLRRVVIRPTYVRLAPGIVQFIEYTATNTVPGAVREYPMQAGTVVVVLGLSKSPITARFWRGNDYDELSFADPSIDERMITYFWQALLSTAPTPPLSADGLSE